MNEAKPGKLFARRKKIITLMADLRKEYEEITLKLRNELETSELSQGK